MAGGSFTRCEECRRLLIYGQKCVCQGAPQHGAVCFDPGCYGQKEDCAYSRSFKTHDKKETI